MSRQIIRRWAVPLLLMIASISFAAPVSTKVTAIRAGHIVNPATGKTVSDQLILIEDGRIKAIGTSLSIPADAEIVDLSDKWIFPGLIDAHTHITLTQTDATVDSIYLSESTAFKALRGARNAQDMLQSGFTAIRDLGNSGDYAAEDLRKAIDMGLLDGPTIITAGKIIAPFGGQTSGIPHETGPFWKFEYLDADTPDELRKAIRTNIYYGADVVKLVADQFAYSYSLEDMRIAVDEAHKAGKPIAVHSFGGQAAQNAIDAGVDSIEHGFELTDAQLLQMKQRGIYLVGTDFPKPQLMSIGMIPNQGKLERPEVMYGKFVDRLRRAYRIGVKLAFGTDEFLEMPGRTRGDLVLEFVDVFRDAGVPAPVVLKAMTTNAAELLRISNDRGAIAVGKAADIVASSSNPLDTVEALKAISFVMKDGKIIRRPR